VHENISILWLSQSLSQRSQEARVVLREIEGKENYRIEKVKLFARHKIIYVFKTCYNIRFALVPCRGNLKEIAIIKID
jgi:hypothetical protein